VICKRRVLPQIDPACEQRNTRVGLPAQAADHFEGVSRHAAAAMRLHVAEHSHSAGIQ
jgi:hypothetical protein